MEEQEKFLNNLKAIKEYWIKSGTTPEMVADGIIFSILVMIDGDSGVNDFHPLKIIDQETGKQINHSRLHEVFSD